MEDSNNLNFEHVVSFGDSLTDTRNVFNFFNSLGIPFPFQPVAEGFYDDGRFSNGPIWIEYFSDALGLAAPTSSTDLSILSPEIPVPSPLAFDSEGLPIVSPFYAGNTVDRSVNFAFGGTSLTTGNGLADGDDGPFPIVEQTVAWFINDHQQANEQINDDTLITLFVPGIADYSGNEDLFILVDEVVDALASIVEDLYANGARNFLISNLPDLRRLPSNLSLSSEVLDVLSKVIDQHNATLEESLATLQDDLEDITIIPVDLFSLGEELASDPGSFGFVEAVQPYLPDFVGLANPDDFFWWDFGNHPTTVGHSLLADLALEAVNSVIEGTAEQDDLVGNRGDNIILGRAENDTLSGRKGDDSLYGGADDDSLKGNQGNDRLHGGEGNDTLLGGQGQDVLVGGDGNDHLVGGQGDDQLYGSEGNDTLLGGQGQDLLVGSEGDDHLMGGQDDDTIIGVNPSQDLAGNGEIDVLTGNQGADRFVLGDANQAYYDDGDDSAQGFGDYALITDFSVARGDVIQLHGAATNYALGTVSPELPQGQAIFLNTSLEPELIAIVQSSNNLDLMGSMFSFA